VEALVKLDHRVQMKMSNRHQDATGIETASSNESSRPPWIASGDAERVAALVLATGLNALPAAVRAKVINHLSRIVGMTWHKSNRGAVRHTRHHLKVLFDYEATDTTLEALVRSHLILSNWNALIANLLPSLRDEHLATLCQIEGLPYVDEIRRQGEAVLLLGFHYGVYGYAIAATLSARGYPTRLVAYGSAHSEPSGTSRLYRKLYWPRLQRVNRWVKTIAIDPSKETQPELRKILEQKEDIVYLLADQYFVVPPGQDHSPHLVPLRLLNHTVYLDVTGVQLAKQMGAQPLTAIPMRTKTEDGYRPRVLIEPMEWVSDGTATADIAQDLQLYLTRLERHLLEYPALWRELRRTELLPRMGVFESEGSAGG
jgi:lauroyl/myristoyl acyltransferase